MDTNTEEKVIIRPDISEYQKGRSGSGSRTMNNGDPVAQALDGMTLDEVKDVAHGMGFEDVDKYDHLNVGQRRMNLGNRIRGAITTIDKEKVRLETEAKAENATKAQVAAASKAKTGAETLEAVVKPIRKVVGKRLADLLKAEQARAEAKAAKEAKAADAA